MGHTAAARAMHAACGNGTNRLPRTPTRLHQPLAKPPACHTTCLPPYVHRPHLLAKPPACPPAPQPASTCHTTRFSYHTRLPTPPPAPACRTSAAPSPEAAWTAACCTRSGRHPPGAPPWPPGRCRSRGSGTSARAAARARARVGARAVAGGSTGACVRVQHTHPQCASPTPTLTSKHMHIQAGCASHDPNQP